MHKPNGERPSRRAVPWSDPKGRQYWPCALDSTHSDTKHTWTHLASLLGEKDKTRRRPLSSFTAESYQSFIDDKVSGIRGRMAEASPAEYRVHTGSLFTAFSAPMEVEVIACVMSFPK